MSDFPSYLESVIPNLADVRKLDCWGSWKSTRAAVPIALNPNAQQNRCTKFFENYVQWNFFKNHVWGNFSKITVLEILKFPTELQAFNFHSVLSECAGCGSGSAGHSWLCRNPGASRFPNREFFQKSCLVQSVPHQCQMTRHEHLLKAFRTEPYELEGA